MNKKTLKFAFITLTIALTLLAVPVEAQWIDQQPDWRIGNWLINREPTITLPPNDGNNPPATTPTAEPSSILDDLNNLDLNPETNPNLFWFTVVVVFVLVAGLVVALQSNNKKQAVWDTKTY